MKPILCFLFPILISFQALSQVNLVPNPSFEDYSLCPTGFDQIERATGWSSYAASPDYFNSCANSSGGVGVPLNTWGYQYAKDGIGYAFVGVYDIQSLPFNTREYIGIELIQPLNSSVKYYVSAYVSRADSNYANGSTNNFGLRFCVNSFSKFNPILPDNFDHVHSDSIIYEHQDWVQIFGTFTPDTNFNFLAIGNFYDNNNTDTAGFNGFGSGYYVDAICVSTDSLYTLNWTNINQESENTIQVKVSKDKIQFFNITMPEQFIMYDLTGKEVFKATISPSNSTFYFPEINENIYLIRLENLLAKKIYIHH